MSLFLKATKSGWYPEFLKPVVEEITTNAAYKKILDIGTGPGTLPKLLIQRNHTLQITGIDINKAMIDKSIRGISHKNVAFKHQQINAPLEFSDEEFDAVTICSVLFFLDNNMRSNLMSESLRVLKPNGTLIILTPSGCKSILSSILEVWKYRFSINNFTFIVWKIFTTTNARKWKRQRWLENYASENKLNYKWSLCFNNNASLEIISQTTK